jgi:predicted TIM-barrel fold metal-dependent hydrolase
MAPSLPTLLALLLAGCHCDGGDHTAEPRPESPVTETDRPDDTQAPQETGDSATPPPSLHSLLRIEAHAHPYDRDGHGEYHFDDGAALAAAAQGNNLRVILASVMFEGDEDDNGRAVLEMALAQPSIIPLLWVHPARDEGAEGAEAWLRDHPFAGLKFHPTHEDLPADSALMDPYLELAARYGVPVVIHTAEDDPSLASRVASLAARHPEVQVVHYHTGLGTDHAAAIEAVRSCPNCWAELSWMALEPSLEAIATLGAERVLFGTDVSIDGPDHYENDWGSGGAGGSWDGWIVDLARQLDRDSYRQVMLLNAVDLFHLVTVHSYQPSASAVSLELDLGHGPLADRLPMAQDDGGWWSRTVPAPRGLRFRLAIDGAHVPCDWHDATGAEVWERDGALVEPPPITTVRVLADPGYGHTVFLRGSGYPLSWGAGEPATWEDDAWVLRLAGVTAPLEVKALVDDASWEQGDNHSVQPGETTEIRPAFDTSPRSPAPSPGGAHLEDDR